MSPAPARRRRRPPRPLRRLRSRWSFFGGLTTAQKNAFKAAADRWSKVIVGDLPDVVIGGQVIDDVLIEASGVPIDGPGGILGQAGPTHLRPAGTGATSLIPAKGRMQFDTADLAAMQSNGTLNDVITHEMGHVLGVGTIWNMKGLLNGTSGSNPTFTGTNAKKEYGVLKGTGPKAVPVENTGGPGTRNSHWRDAVFVNELMTGFVNSAPNPMSRVTVASLKESRLQGRHDEGRGIWVARPPRTRRRRDVACSRSARGRGNGHTDRADDTAPRSHRVT